ncbi:MAG: CBS domain-containing protein [Asgard group archaeon]|nr:CBS domain-containing protein [Asgard group archaeon]
MPKKLESQAKAKMQISEVMTSTVHTIYPQKTVKEAAELMKKLHIGCIIIEPKKDEKTPLGIVTERDIVTRVVAEGKDPAKIPVVDIATKPVVTAPPSMEISEAMYMLSKLHIRRLVIMEENEIIGIATDRDLLRVAPSLLEIALEFEHVNKGPNYEAFPNFEEYLHEEEEDEGMNLTVGYYCSECGEQFKGEPAGEINGEPLCPACKNIIDTQ